MPLGVKLTKGGLVMANLGCQCDYVQKPLKPKQLGMSGRDFLDWIIQSGKTHSESTPSGSPSYKRPRKKGAFAFCLLALAVTGKFIYPTTDAFLWTYFTMKTRDQQLSRNSLGLQRQIC